MTDIKKIINEAIEENRIKSSGINDEQCPRCAEYGQSKIAPEEGVKYCSACGNNIEGNIDKIKENTGSVDMENDLNDKFHVHGTYTVSNVGGYEIMLSDDGGMAKVKDSYGSDNPQTSEWLDIEDVPTEGGESEQVIDPNGYNIPLNQVMRKNINEENPANYDAFMEKSKEREDVIEQLTPIKISAIMETFIRNEDKFQSIYNLLNEEGFVPKIESDIEKQKTILREMVKDGNFTKDMLHLLAENNHLKITINENMAGIGSVREVPVDYDKNKREIRPTGDFSMFDDPKGYVEKINQQVAQDEIKAKEKADKNPVVDKVNDEILDSVVGDNELTQAKHKFGDITDNLKSNLAIMKEIAETMGFATVNEYLGYIRENFETLESEQKEYADWFISVKNKNKELSMDLQGTKEKVLPKVDSPMEVAEAKNKQLGKGTGNSELQLRAGTFGKIFENRIKKLDSYKKIALLEFFETDAQMLDDKDYLEMANLTNINESDIIAMRIEYEKHEDMINEVNYPVFGGQDVRGENEKTAKKELERDLRQADESQETIEEKVYDFKEKKFSLTDISQNVPQTDKEDQNRGQHSQVGFLKSQDGSDDEKEKYDAQANGETNVTDEENTDANVGDGKVYGSEGTTSVGDDIIKKGEEQEEERQEEPTYPKEDVPVDPLKKKLPVNEDIDRMKGLFNYDAQRYINPKNKNKADATFERQLNEMREKTSTLITEDKPSKEQLDLMTEVEHKGQKAKTDGFDYFDNDGNLITEGCLEECGVKEARNNQLKSGLAIDPHQLEAGTISKKRLQELSGITMEGKGDEMINSNPYNMQVIINIQNMRDAIMSNYDNAADFDNLKMLSYNELHNLQNALVPEYNKAVGRKESGVGNGIPPTEDGKNISLEETNYKMPGVKTIQGFYGTNNPSDIFVYNSWYVVEDSVNVNKTNDVDRLVDGVNVESISDVDMFTAGSPIQSEDDLVRAVDGDDLDEAKNHQLKHTKGTQLKTGTKEEDVIDEAKNHQLKHTKGTQLKTGTKTKEEK